VKEPINTEPKVVAANMKENVEMKDEEAKEEPKKV